MLWIFLSFITLLQAFPPIDVVIPCIEADLPTLDYAIEGIRKCPEVRRVIVVSATRLTAKAEWFDEALYPFTKAQVTKVLPDKHKPGWYYQQLLKLYAPFVIPKISPNVLVLDADTIFLRPVRFLNDQGGAFLNTGEEFHPPYFEHAAKLIPGFRRVFPELSGVTHHMLFQRPILKSLFAAVEKKHRMPFWKAFCTQVSPHLLFPFSGASEYEIYFNYALSYSDQVTLRKLIWKNITTLEFPEGYDYVSAHAWMREAPN